MLGGSMSKRIGRRFPILLYTALAFLLSACQLESVKRGFEEVPPVSDQEKPDEHKSLDRFSLVVIPDTQNMVSSEARSRMVEEMISWTVDSAEHLELAFVTHVGDVVSRAIRDAEWARANRALSQLDGVLPYSVAFGNHEYSTHSNMDTPFDNYLRYFGPERYATYAWYGGSDDSSKNHFQRFTAAGRDFLHRALESEVPGEVNDPTTAIGWAREVLEEYEGVPTIITTHAYLWDEPGREGRSLEPEGPWHTGRDTGSNSGEEIFRKIVEPYPQVFM